MHCAAYKVICGHLKVASLEGCMSAHNPRESPTSRREGRSPMAPISSKRFLTILGKPGDIIPIHRSQVPKAPDSSSHREPTHPGRSSSASLNFGSHPPISVCSRSYTSHWHICRYAPTFQQHLQSRILKQSPEASNKGAQVNKIPG